MFGRKCVGLLLVLLLATSAAFAQGVLGKVIGTVQDSTGAVIVGAKLDLVDQATGAKRSTTSGTDGKFIFLGIQNGLYKLTVTMQGFQTGVFPDVKVDLGRTAEVTAQLQVGQVQSEVVVEAAAEVLQTQTTAIEGGVQGRQLRSLPMVNRDVLDFVLLMPGAQQVGQTRQSTFEGLPKSALNITMDGINIQDNAGKSSSNGGYFTSIRPKQDAIEEIQVTTGNNTADNAGSGAVQIKFVTRRGTNDWHGGLFEFYRDQGLNANTFFNNRKGLGRQTNHLNQYGGSIGGPLVKNKLFIFNNFEDFRLPQSFPRTSSIMTANSLLGKYDYLTDAGAPATTVDLFQIAAAYNAANEANLPTTMNPLVAQELSQINQLRDASKLLAPVAIGAGASPWYQSVSWNAASNTRRFFNTTRIDYDVNDKVRWNVVANWNHFQSDPDLLNAMDPSFPLIPGVSTPDASTLHGGQNGERWSLVSALNWTITPKLNYEFRVGRTSSISHFNDGMNFNKLFPLGYGFNFSSLGLPSLYGYENSSGFAGVPNNRDTPVITMIHNFGYITGKHTITFGGQLDLIKYWETYYNYYGVPTVALGCPGGCSDTSIWDGDLYYAFNNSTIPGAPNHTDRVNTARALYSTLIGEVASADYSFNLDPRTKQYGAGSPYEDTLKQKELGVYIADSFRATKTLTLNFGLRWEYQGSVSNPNGTYTQVGLENGPTWQSAWGISGIGNIFKPGTVAGGTPQYYLQDHNFYAASKGLAPSFGLAWSPNYDNKIWKLLFGGAGKTVFRGGYSIANSREGLYSQEGNLFNSPQTGQTRTLSPGFDFFTSSVGRLMLSDINPATGNFSYNGSVVPYEVFPTAFQFPMSFTDNTFFGAYVNSVNPHIKLPYVQSWSFGLQRELSSNMVLEARYQGNHGTQLWRDFDINEVNIFENGFLNEFRLAQNNLSLCLANQTVCKANAGVSGSGTYYSFANWNVPGQVALPIMETAFGGNHASNFSSSAWVGFLQQNVPGTMANNLAYGSSFSRLCRMVGANLQGCRNVWGYTQPGNYPANFWTVNPDADGGSYILTNAGDSFYDAFIVEMRRRMSKGLMIQGNYTFSKSLTNFYADSTNSYAGFRTLRDTRLDRGLSPYDITHVARIFWTWELPFGPGRHFTAGNKVLSKAIEGWEFTGIAALQSGRVFRFTSPSRTNGNGTFNQNDGGLNLNGITLQQLQSLISVNKDMTTYPSCTSGSKDYVYFLPLSMVASDCTAYHWDPVLYNDGKIQAFNTAGQMGSNIYLHGPHFVKPDFTIAKQTKVTERVNARFEARFFNAFNITNFFVGSVSGVAPSNGLNSTTFGRTSSYYQDLNGNQDPGPRMIELVLRLNF